MNKLVLSFSTESMKEDLTYTKSVLDKILNKSEFYLTYCSSAASTTFKASVPAKAIGNVRVRREVDHEKKVYYSVEDSRANSDCDPYVLIGFLAEIALASDRQEPDKEMVKMFDDWTKLRLEDN